MRNVVVAGGLVILLGVSSAHALDGPRPTAYGTKAQGMGGASIALPQDSIAAANNPAGLAFVGSRFDVDVQLIGVWADSEFLGAQHSGSILVPVPEFGVNWEINPQWTLGISTAPLGAAFSYDNSLFPGIIGQTSGFFLTSVVIPTVTYRPVENFSIGVSVAGALQTFNIDNFAGVGNHGFNWTTGAGWRIGALWKVSDQLSIGATYASQIQMGRLSGYGDDILAPVGGRLDVPAEYGVGVAYKLAPNLTLALDYLRINWSETQWKELFGYRDQDVARIGVAYDIDEKWTVRAGASFARRQFSSDYVANNILLVGINTNAITAGVTRRLDDASELSAAIEYDYGRTAQGSGPSFGTSVDANIAIAAISYGRKF